jgi:hypothetical protein
VTGFESGPVKPAVPDKDVLRISENEVNSYIRDSSSEDSEVRRLTQYEGTREDNRTIEGPSQR